MAQLAEVCSPKRKAGQARQRLALKIRRQRTADPGLLAEEMLREMAFVYHATRCIKESMAEELAAAPCRITSEENLVPRP